VAEKAANCFPERRDAVKVLIAEDEVLHAEMLNGMVASWGHAVTAVESGWCYLPRFSKGDLLFCLG